MEKKYFGKSNSNQEIFSYTINHGENALCVLNYGGTIQSLKIKNKNGKLVDVVLGYDNIEQYEKTENRTYFGAVCGRVANRIGEGKFFVDAIEYKLPKNDKGNCLHGGENGFDKKLFELTASGEDFIVLSTTGQDGEEGFPGEVLLSVKYTFKGGLLMIEYYATTTSTCPAAFTNHSYFNLDGTGTISTHSLQLNSQFFLEIDDNGLAIGVVKSTRGTDLDFAKETELGERISSLKRQRPTIKGIDHYLFCDSGITEYRRFGTLSNSERSLKLDIFTNQTGAQIYTGNYIPKGIGKDVEICENSGVCFETHTPPNSLGFSHLPTMLLKPGENYYHKTGYRFYF